jgi:hypothetical protein
MFGFFALISFSSSGLIFQGYNLTKLQLFFPVFRIFPYFSVIIEF